MRSDDIVTLGIPELGDAVEIGSGGFGTVYRAEQPALRRTVAVKTLRNAVRDEKVRIRFEREIQAMGMLSGHPNIVTVHDSGFTSSGQPYILMALMEDGSLGDRVAGQGPLPWQEVLDVAVKVAGALETAHQAGILHRDIKPENILMSAYGEPKLGDFGIARLRGGPETRTDTLTASIAHVAPELLAGQPPSVATDLYALGSTMFTLLSGSAAFLRDTDESIVPALTRIGTEPVPDLRPRGVPGPVCELVERLMEKEPAARFPSAEEFGRAAQDVQRALGVSPSRMAVRSDAAHAARRTAVAGNSGDVAPPAPASGGSPGEGTADSTPAGEGAPAGRAPDDDARSGALAGASPLAPLPGPGRASRPLPDSRRPAAAPASGITPPSAPAPLFPPPSAPAPVFPPGPAAAPPPSRRGLVIGLAAGGAVLVAVVAVVAVAMVRSGTGPGPTPTVDPTEIATPDDYAAYAPVTDDADVLTVTVPEEWDDVDGSAWEIDGDEIGVQVQAAPDLGRFQETWNVPGLIFGASSLLVDDGSLEDLLDAVDFSDQCTGQDREEYDDGVYTGFEDHYTACGRTDTTYTVIAALPEDESYVVLVQIQAVDPRDVAAGDRIVDSFLVTGEVPAP